jgi:nucleosome binding factor SPN SPT16 subunit
MSHKGVFLVSLGMRYKGYCANLGRTFIVDPDKVGVHIFSAAIYGPHLSKGARVCL